MPSGNTGYNGGSGSAESSNGETASENKSGAAANGNGGGGGRGEQVRQWGKIYRETHHVVSNLPLTLI